MPEYLLTVNLDADTLAEALVKSANNLDPIRAPQFTVGRDRQFRIELVTKTGASPLSGDSEYNLAVAIGQQGAIPTGGTFGLDFGAGAVPLKYDTSATDFQDAINDAAAVVSGKPGSFWRIEYADETARDLPTLTDNHLGPESSVTIRRIQAADTGKNEIHLVRLKQLPVVLQLDWTPDNGGWTGTLPTRTIAALRAITEANPYSGTLEISLTENEIWTPILAVPVKIFGDVADEASFVPPGFTLENFRGPGVPPVEGVPDGYMIFRDEASEGGTKWDEAPDLSPTAGQLVVGSGSAQLNANAELVAMSHLGILSHTTAGTVLIQLFNQALTALPPGHIVWILIPESGSVLSILAGSGQTLVGTSGEGTLETEGPFVWAQLVKFSSNGWFAAVIGGTNGGNGGNGNGEESGNGNGNGNGEESGNGNGE